MDQLEQDTATKPEVSVVPAKKSKHADNFEGSNVERMLMVALDKGLDIGILERFMALRDKELAARAKAAYDSAMASFQAECPVIEKTKQVKNKSGVVVYTYAPIDSVIDQTHELIGKNGLSYTFHTEKIGSGSGEGMKVTCRIKHRDGHSEDFSMESGLANRTDIMSAPQQVAATMTFLKRHSFMNGFGIGTGDADLDATEHGTDSGNGATQEQFDEIGQLTERCSLDHEYVENRCFELYGVKFRSINKNQADGLIKMLTKKAATPKSPQNTSESV